MRRWFRDLLRRRAGWPALIGGAAALLLALAPWAALAQDGASLADSETVKQWEAFGALLPAAVGLVIGFLVRGRGGRLLERAHQAAIAGAVYVAYGLVGNWLAGDFAALTFGTAAEVFASIVKVAAFGQAAYMTLFKLFPLPDYLEAAAGGESVAEQRASFNRG